MLLKSVICNKGSLEKTSCICLYVNWESKDKDFLCLVSQSVALNLTPKAKISPIYILIKRTKGSKVH